MENICALCGNTLADGATTPFPNCAHALCRACTDLAEAHNVVRSMANCDGPAFPCPRCRQYRPPDLGFERTLDLSEWLLLHPEQRHVDFEAAESSALAEIYSVFDEMHAMLRRAEVKAMDDVDAAIEDMDNNCAVWTNVAAVMEQECTSVMDTKQEGAAEVLGEMAAVLGGLRANAACVEDVEERVVTVLDDTADSVRAGILRHCVETYKARGDYLQAGLCCLNSDAFKEAEELFAMCEDSTIDKNELSLLCYYGRCALDSNVECMSYFAEKHRCGNEYFLQSARKAFLWYMKGSEHGNADSEYGVAYCYDKGIGVTENCNEALEWYMKAANHGHPNAQYRVAYCLEKGVGTKKSSEESFEWFMKSAQNGSIISQHNVAEMLFLGRGVERDYGQAFAWFTKLAGSEYCNIYYTLGVMVFHGLGTKRDAEAALKWFARSAQHGHPAGIMMTEEFGHRSSGMDRLRESPNEAFEEFRNAAERDEVEGLFMTGFCYHSGQGCAVDFFEAERNYRLAAEQGHARAQCMMGYIYLHAEMVYGNREEGAEWLRRASEKGDMLATYLYGECLLEGNGVQMNPKAGSCLIAQAEAAGVNPRQMQFGDS